MQLASRAGPGRAHEGSVTHVSVETNLRPGESPVGWASAHAVFDLKTGHEVTLLESAHREYLPGVQISLCFSDYEARVQCPSSD